MPIVVVIVLLVLWQKGAPSPVTSVDPGPDIAYAQRISPVPLPAPGPLPGNWRATSSHVDAPAGEKRSPVTLTIGYLTDENQFAEVVIGDRPGRACCSPRPSRRLDRGRHACRSARPAGRRTGRSAASSCWPTTIGKAGVLVTGDASGTDLAELAAAVR